MKKVLLAFIIICALNTNAQICFDPSISYLEYNNVENGTCLISKDFNGDGNIDIVQGANDSISILLGTGTGNFGIAKSFATGGYNIYSVCSTDFNRDGKADLAVANYNPSNVSVLLGNGMGGFGSATTFTVISIDPSPTSICTADFNGDTLPDLAVTLGNTSYLCILLGNGLGNFGPPHNFSIGTNPNSVISADFNGDGKMDLASTSSLDSVCILLGDGLGNFGLPLNFATGSAGVCIINSDFNADGKTDIATANYGSNNVSVLLGMGNGSFGSSLSFPAGVNPGSITSGDFNLDGKIDLAVPNIGSNNVSLLLGTGTGLFGAPLNFGVGTYPVSITCKDYNGDGKLDIVTANYDTIQISVLLSCETTGLTSQKNNIQVSIYPNPNNGSFVIDPNNIPKQTIQVYDVNGKLVLSQTINGKTSIDASSLNEGVYNISIISSDGIVNKRLVIVR